MRDACYKEMEAILVKYLGAYRQKKVKLIDVGSMDSGGGFRGLISPDWQYVGVDCRAGKNVDVVLKDPYVLPFADNSADVVISAQYLEHMEKPWLFVREMARIIDDGGGCFICASAKGYLQGYPQDYWRIYPEGIRVLLAEAGLTVIETYTVPVDALLAEEYLKHETVDCWGIAIKCKKTQQRS